jgi:UDP-N-acetyl-2-amino-2-deoxyglucuronate dehydrogenase
MLDFFLDSRFHGNDSQESCHSSEGWNPVPNNMTNRNINNIFLNLLNSPLIKYCGSLITFFSAPSVPLWQISNTPYTRGIEMSKVKLAFIGCGGMAGAHLGGYIELKRKGIDTFDIVALADPVEQNTARFAEAIEQVQTSPKPIIYSDYEKMLKEQELDGADICTPHYLHHICAIACLEAGVNAIVEKPLGVTMRATRKMVESAKQNGKILAVAEQVRRWMGPRIVAWAIHSGIIGTPRMFFAQGIFGSNTNPDVTVSEHRFTWRSEKLTGGGGPIFDWGVHYADLLIHFFGEVDTIYANTRNFAGMRHKDDDGNPKPQTVEDTSIASLTFKNGVIGTWNYTHVAPGRSFANTVYYGSKGSIYGDSNYPTSPQLQLWDGTTKDTNELIADFLAANDEATIQRFFPPEVCPDPANLTGDYGVMLEVYDFINAIREGRRPDLDGWDGLIAQAVPEAFFESSECGQSVKMDDILSGRVDAYQREINDKWGI